MDGAIGQPIRRKEDQRLLVGEGEFSDDHSLPHQCWAVMVRCPFAHAVIKNIDTQIAKAKTGVLGIFTGEDCEADGLGQIPHSPFPSTKFDMKLHGPGGTVGDNSFAGINTVLPTDKGRYVGEAIAMVVAETKMQAAEAAEFLEIDYEILPSVTNTRAAAGESAS